MSSIETVSQISVKDRRTLYYVATGLATFSSSRSKAGLKRLSAAGLVDSWKRPHEAKLTPRGAKIATDAGWQLKGDGSQLALFDGSPAVVAVAQPAPAPVILAESPTAPAVEARPFLKYAGGKGRLLADIKAEMPETFGRLFVPFVGAGALPLSMPGRVAYISDENTYLINCYVCVRDRAEDVIAALQEHKSDDVYYYPLRDAFNEGYGDPVWRAAAFIYMNKAGFNGVCRFNQKGEFNAPWGKNPNVTICDADNLRACSAALRDIEIVADDFREVEARVQPGDCLYLDPPYLPESKTASFTGYWGKWGNDEHEACASLFRRLAARGVHVLASNSDTPRARELYAGFEIRTLYRSNSVNSKASARGGKAEILVLGGTWTPRGAS